MLKRKEWNDFEEILTLFIFFLSIPKKSGRNTHSFNEMVVYHIHFNFDREEKKKEVNGITI